jgi:hypothetical protein
MNLAAFRKNLIKPSVKLRYKFLYDGVDKTSMIIKNGLGTIRRDINLSAGIATLTLNNAGGWWNSLHQTNNALRDSASIQVYVDGDAANAYTLFAGTVHHPVYEGSTVTIQIKDHNSKFLDRKVGSNASPSTLYSSGTSAEVKVWRLLTTEGELDSLNAPANTDIDYASFARWRDQHIVPNNYAIAGRPKGQTVGQLLMIICQMTHSYMWVNNDGLVEFAPPFEPGYTYSEGNTGTMQQPGQGRDLDLSDNKILNDVTVRSGYNHSTGEWVHADVNDTDATSIAKFGTFPTTIEGRIFWHSTQASATSDRDATLTNYAFPLRFWNITGGYPAIMEDLCRQITISDTLKEASSVQPYVEQIIYNLNTWSITMKARWAW